MRVGVIGAGPAGLVATKELVEAGCEVVAFEAQAGVGGLFRYDEAVGFTWDNLRLTSSSLVTSFSDWPAPTHAPPHLRHDEYVAYLESYARAFDLHRHLRLSTPVDEVRPDEGGGWWIRTGRGESERFDRLVVCSGLHRRPRLPAIPGLASFPGRVMHSSKYRRAAPFRDRTVLVLGAGESGAEIAAQIADVAAECVVSAPHGALFLPRFRLEGGPFDYSTNRLTYAPSLALERLTSGSRARLLATAPIAPWTWGPLLRRALGVRPRPPRGAPDRIAVEAVMARAAREGRSTRARFSTKSEALAIAIAEGRSELRGAVACIEGRRASFHDGSELEPDDIVCCTGFETTWPFLGEHAPGHDLYRHVFSPRLGPSIAFVGFARPAIGAIPPICEMQSRWVARVFTGRTALPPPAVMYETMAEDAAFTRERFAKDAEHLPYLVDYVRYMDTLAETIGCMPALSDLRSYRLLRAFLCGPILPLHYRLVGPGALSDAAARLEGVPIVGDSVERRYWLALSHLLGLVVPELGPEHRFRVLRGAREPS